MTGKVINEHKINLKGTHTTDWTWKLVDRGFCDFDLSAKVCGGVCAMNDTVDCFKQGLKCNENKINLSNPVENDNLS